MVKDNFLKFKMIEISNGRKGYIFNLYFPNNSQMKPDILRQEIIK